MTDSATIASSHQGVLQGALPATSNRRPTCRQAGIKAGGRAPPFASLGATSTPHPPATSPDAASSPPPQNKHTHQTQCGQLVPHFIIVPCEESTRGACRHLRGCIPPPLQGRDKGLAGAPLTRDEANAHGGEVKV